MRHGDEAGGQHELRCREQAAETHGCRKPAAEKVSCERAQCRHHERLVVNVRTHSTLRQDGLVEEPDPGRDQPVESGTDGKHPECGRRHGGAPRPPIQVLGL
jgi:hypothetical protein